MNHKPQKAGRNAAWNHGSKKNMLEIPEIWKRTLRDGYHLNCNQMMRHGGLVVGAVALKEEVLHLKPW